MSSEKDKNDKKIPEDLMESVKQENERVSLENRHTEDSDSVANSAPKEDEKAAFEKTESLNPSKAEDALNPTDLTSENEPEKSSEKDLSSLVDSPENNEESETASSLKEEDENPLLEESEKEPESSEEKKAALPQEEADSNRKPEDKNEIDEFTQKLLNRKTEMAIWPEEEKKPEEKKEMSEEERKAAEVTLSDALDQLRKQRGQVPIEQEEEDFAWDHIHFQDRFDGGEDFTTQSLFLHEKTDQVAAESGKYENTPKAKKEDYLEEAEKRPGAKKSRISGATARLSKTVQKVVPEAEPAKKPKKKKKRKLRKQAVTLICVIVGLILVLFAGYYYKTAVYDPANNVSEAQQAAYDKLLAYAEEYSMSSDAEKLELLRMEGDYNSQTDKQKEQLNERFVKNTGKNFDDLVAELKTKDGTVNTEDDPVYTGLMDYVNSYGSLDDEQKAQITDYQADYDSLSTALKANVDAAMQAQIGKSFTEALTEVQNGGIPQTPGQTDGENGEQEDGSAEPSSPDQTDSSEEQASRAAQAAEYQQMIDQTAALRDDYLASLAEDGLSAEGDEVIAEYDQEIAYWQGLLASVQ